MNPTGARQWVETLRLSRHPEGGWFREVYRATEAIPHHSLPDRFTGDRSYATAIYFLLDDTDFSALHRIKQDEVWHFYDGHTLTLHVIDAEGAYSTRALGRDVAAGERPMTVVEAGCLFGATVRPGTYALVGCTVSPGFDFEDFEVPGRATLVERHSQHRAVIERLTR